MKRPPRRSRLKTVLFYVVYFIALVPLMASIPPDDGGVLSAIAMTYAICLAAMIIHEAGHAIIGISADGQMIFFCVRPILISIKPRSISYVGKHRYRDRVQGGAVAFRFKDGTRRGRHWGAVIAAGPIANFLTAIAAMSIGLAVASGNVAEASIAAFVIISTWVGLANLVPIDRCDGWKLLLLYRSRALRRRLRGVHAFAIAETSIAVAADCL
jgi:Zn-dependent protease